MNTPQLPASSPFPADLEALAAQARADLDAATVADPRDVPAWCRRLAAARHTQAAIYRLATAHVPPTSLTGSALRDAIRLCEAHRARLISQAVQAEQKGR